MNTKMWWLLIVVALLIGFFGGKQIFQPKESKIIQNVVARVDTLYKDRQSYVHDTVIVKQKIVVNHFEKVSGNLDSIFSGKDSVKKVSLFDSVYYSKDTIKFLDISQDQAKQAIEAKYLFERDSALLGICLDNVKNADETISEMKTNVDSLKNVRVSEEHFWRDSGIGFGVGLTFLFAYILSGH